MRILNHHLEQLRASLDDPERATDRTIDLHANANDASHFLLMPQALVRAGNAAEVGRLLKTSSRNGIPLAFRSGGTSLSGQSATDGVLVDVRRHFQSVEVLDDGQKVRVQPGATLRQVNNRLAIHGRKVGPDPASEVACTIGGIIANNSSGMACGTTDNCYNTLESLVIVLPSGTVINSADTDADGRLRHDEPALHGGIARLRDRIRSNPASVRRIRAQFSMKNTMGYSLNSFLDFDAPVQILAHLMVGSEGTLGFIASAVLRTIKLSTHQATSLLIFDGTTSATDALPALIDTGAATLELMDSTALRVGQNGPGAPAIIRDLNVDRHAALLVEYQCDDAEQLAMRRADFDRFTAKTGRGTTTALSTDKRLRAELWHLRKGLYAQIAGARPAGTTALLEDVVVPVERLSATCDGLTRLFDHYGYRDSVIFGHAKDGNIHFMLTDRFIGDGLDRYAAFTEDMVDLILGAEGSLKAEHGTGRVMAPYVRRQFGDELYDVMRELKRLCDPSGILNPGVLLDEDPQAHLRHIKDAPTIEPEADRCVECGYCEPVCPSRSLTLTPRQRIVVHRSIQRARDDGDQDLATELKRDYDYEGLQTCAVDGMCQTACPVQINTGDLVKRLRAEANGPVEKVAWNLAARNWGAVTTAASAALNVASLVPPALIEGPNRLARKVLGNDVLPLWSSDLPRGGSPRSSGQSGKDPAAVYLPACIGKMFGPPTGRNPVQQSFQTLCERAGIELAYPDDVDSLCCGTPPSSKGFTQAAGEMRKRTLASLRRATRNGQLPVISDATSCTEALVKIVESDTTEPRMRVIDAVEYAAEHIVPRLTVTARLDRLVLHPTCSSTRLGIAGPLADVAAKVADDVVIPDSWGCCAFAGDRGMLHPELTASATTAEAASVRELDAEAYASCSRTCELGMSRATGQDYVHVLSLLEEATRTADLVNGQRSGDRRSDKPGPTLTIQTTS